MSDFFTPPMRYIHRNFYEAQMNKEVVEIALEDVEKLITKLKEIE